MSPTTEIKASDVQKLRQMTGAGMMDCKKALADSQGKFEAAIKVLRERGIAKSSKRADRDAGEGLIACWISNNQKSGIMLELNSETDFVARNEEFVILSQQLLKKIQENSSWTSPDQVPSDSIQALSGKIGEKIALRRFVRMKNDKGLVAGYIHTGAKLGVLLELESDKDVSKNSAIRELSRELTLQIAGANPSYVSRDDVPADVIQREKDITKKQMEGQKKPPEILEKIAVGKLQQFYLTHCLVDQPHVRDSAGKTKVQDLIKQVSDKEGIQLKVVRFVRFRVGAE